MPTAAVIMMVLFLAGTWGIFSFLVWTAARRREEEREE